MDLTKVNEVNRAERDERSEFTEGEPSVASSAKPRLFNVRD